MKLAIATLESVSNYSQSKLHNVEKLPKESADDYEKRTWREKGHYNHDGNLYIPPMAFKNCLSEAAKYLGMQIQGKGKATYTKHFEAGVLVTDALVLPVKKDEVQGEWLHMNADGRRGSGKRVLRCYPVVPYWKGQVTFYVMDETITRDVLLHHLKQAGSFIGIGRFRPRNNGIYGRFRVLDLGWQDMPADI